MLGAELLALLRHLGQENRHRLLGPIAPITAKNEVDADDIIAVVAGANLIAVGAGYHVDPGLQAAIITESDGYSGLKIDRLGAGLVSQAGQGGIGIQALGDHLVVIAAEGQIKAEEDVQIIHLDGTDAQMIRSQLQKQAVQLQGVADRWRIDVPAGQPFGFDAGPTVGVRTAILFQIEFAAVVFAKASHRGELFLNPLKEVQQRLALMRQIQLRAEANVDVEIVAKRSEWIGHRFLPVTRANEHGTSAGFLY